MNPLTPGAANVHSAYVVFKDDRERRLALMSRDLKSVLIVLIFVAGGVQPALWRSLWKLFGGS